MMHISLQDLINSSVYLGNRVSQDGKDIIDEYSLMTFYLGILAFKNTDHFQLDWDIFTQPGICFIPIYAPMDHSLTFLDNCEGVIYDNGFIKMSLTYDRTAPIYLDNGVLRLPVRTQTQYAPLYLYIDLGGMPTQFVLCEADSEVSYNISFREYHGKIDSQPNQQPILSSDDLLAILHQTAN